MKLSEVPNLAATVLLGLLFLVTNIGSALYSAHGLQPPGAVVLLCYAGLGFAAALWIQADKRRFAFREVVDQGWVFIGWPVMLPYHLFQTRGRRGAITLLGLIGLYLATYLVGVAVFLLARQNIAAR